MKPIVAFVFAGIVGGAGGALLVQPFPDHPVTVAAPFLVATASISIALEPEGEELDG